MFLVTPAVIEEVTFSTMCFKTINLYGEDLIDLLCAKQSRMATGDLKGEQPGLSALLAPMKTATDQQKFEKKKALLTFPNCLLHHFVCTHTYLFLLSSNFFIVKSH